jgi:hypothetical protein
MEHIFTTKANMSTTKQHATIMAVYNVRGSAGSNRVQRGNEANLDVCCDTFLRCAEQQC